MARPKGSKDLKPRLPRGESRRDGKPPELKVHVTQQAIDHAIKGDSSRCMIADSIRKQHPNLSRISVDMQFIRATNLDKRERYIWATPVIGQAGLVMFDDGQKMKPFTFSLNAANSQIIRMDERIKNKNIRRKQKSRKARVIKVRGQGSARIVGGQEPPNGDLIAALAAPCGRQERRSCRDGEPP